MGFNYFCLERFNIKLIKLDPAQVFFKVSPVAPNVGESVFTYNLLF